MSLNLTPTTPGVSAVSPPRITVIGVGGGGVNAVNNMIAGNLRGVNFIAANTDAQQLGLSKAETRLQLGPTLTRGLGAGAKPEVGRKSAEEVEEEIRQHLEGVDLVFVTSGMGGGTGTGAAPVVARIAHETGALTIGVVSKPFKFEGLRRCRAAEEGIAELEKYVDTLLVIPNQNLFNRATPNTSLMEAFKMADDVLYRGVRSVTDLMVEAGYQNLDFADVRTVMSGMGKAMMGIGTASADEDGEDWATLAAERAISNPLLEETSIQGARALLVNVTLGPDMSLLAYNEIMDLIRETANCEDEEINSGFVISEDMTGKVQVSVIATGLDKRNVAKNAENAAPEATSEQSADEANVSSDASIDAAALTQGSDAAQTEGLTDVPAEANSAETDAVSLNQQPNYQLNRGPHHAPVSQGQTPPRKPIAEEPPAHTGGLFSRFFRSRPAPEPTRQAPTLNPVENHSQPHEGNGAPTPSDDANLDIPAYLRREQK